MKLGSLIIATGIAFPVTMQAQVVLPRIIRDSMVLQRGIPLNLWGWASKGEKVTVKFRQSTRTAKTSNDGKWAVQLPPQNAGGPYTLEISGKNKILLHDILVGEVWLCAGQSNMEHQLKLHDIVYAAAIAGANYPEIRQFKIPNITSLTGTKDDLPGGSWNWANPSAVREFSAVAYFFAKALYQKYHVPVGIINASWGGIPIESMMSEESLKAFPVLLATVQKNKDTAYVNGENRRAAQDMRALPQPKDKGMTEKWFDTAYVPKGWHAMAIPGYWEDQGVLNVHGAVWYRREITIPASMANKSARVLLGRIVDADELYINGKKAGNTTYLYPQRRYGVEAGVLKPGKNLFVIRVINYAGKGGFVPDKPYKIVAGNDTVDLTGYWQYKVGYVNAPGIGTVRPGIALQNQPAALYNAMLHPVIGYGIKGFAWYQGESNTSRADEYARLQPSMITDWRHRWQEGDIPFLFVQLPGFMGYNYLPGESSWALFREAQAQSLLLSNTAMAVAIDLGEWNDVHPDRKKEIGDRLALAAERIAYGDTVVYAGPVFTTAVIDGDKMILSFDYTGGGLITNDGEAPRAFAIAGADTPFVWATPKIAGDKIIAWSDEIKEPKFIRYSWADNPVDPNLYNKEGLPASPFRSDP